MDLGSILLILALALAVSLYVSRPLIEKRGKIVTHQEHDLSHLLAERERILTIIQELDFDFALGKVPEAGYPAQRTALLESGATVLRQLDEIQGKGTEKTAEARLEAAIEIRRAAMGVSTASAAKETAPRVVLPDDQVEALLAQRRRSRYTTPGQRSAGFCSKCGTPLQQSDQFCSKCGTRV